MTINNKIPNHLKIDGKMMKNYDLTEIEISLMNDILLEHQKNKTEMKGWNKPELARFDDTKGFVKGNVEIVCRLIFSLIEYVRDLRATRISPIPKRI